MYFKITLLSVFLSFFLFNTTYGQTLRWEELTNNTRQLKDLKIPKGKSLLIFESPVNLSFESSIENINQPERKDNKYFLYVSKGPQVITFNYMGNYHINFGQIMAENTLPALKSKEIRYFRITINHELEYYNITEKEKEKGNIVIPVGVNVSDALVVFNVFPPDLDISIEGNGITKQSSDNGTFKVFLKAPNNTKLKINCKDFDPTIISINGLKAKETRFFFIRRPITINDYKEKKITSIDIDRSKKLIGQWGGSLGANKVFLEIQDINSGKIKGRIFKDGEFSNIVGVIKTKSKGQIYITLHKLASKYSKETGTIDFVLEMGVGSGTWISDNGDVKDLSIMRTKELLPDHGFTYQISKINGWWKSSNTKLFKWIRVNKIDNYQISGSVIDKKNNKYTYIGDLIVKNNSINIVINLKGQNKMQGVILLKLNSNYSIASGTYLSDDASVFANIKFSKYSSCIKYGDNSDRNFKKMVIDGIYKGIKNDDLDGTNLIQIKDINDRTYSFYPSDDNINLTKGCLYRVNLFEKECYFAPLNKYIKVKIATKLTEINRIDEIKKTSYTLESAKFLSSVHTKNTKGHIIYGSLLYIDKSYDQAAKEFESALKIDSTNQADWEMLLFSLFMNNNNKSLLNYSSRAKKLFPKMELSYFFEASSYYNTNQFKKAIKLLEESMHTLNNMKKSDYFYALLGTAYYYDNQHNKAFIAFSKSLEINPESSRVLNNYAYCLAINNQDLEKAKEMSAHAIKNAPKNAKYNDTYGLILFKLEEYDESYKYLQLAIQLSGNPNADYYKHISDVLFKLGKKSKAKSYLRKAAKVNTK